MTSTLLSTVSCLLTVPCLLTIRRHSRFGLPILDSGSGPALATKAPLAQGQTSPTPDPFVLSRKPLSGAFSRGGPSLFI